jgi:hypothetical protein
MALAPPAAAAAAAGGGVGGVGGLGGVAGYTVDEGPGAVLGDGSFGSVVLGSNGAWTYTVDEAKRGQLNAITANAVGAAILTT